MNAAQRRTFIEQYGLVRQAEGRGSTDAAYYRALPYADLTGCNRWQWRIRARTFDHFLRRILTPLETRLSRPLDRLDLGAGNGWMSWRLSQWGHRVMAVDIFDANGDGLGAMRKYAQLNAVNTDFDELPFPAATFDAAIYNASVHYSPNYERTRREAIRCLRPGGKIIILDSPVYTRAEHGEKMRQERQSLFERVYGFRSEALGSIEYLDRAALRRLSHDLHIKWHFSKPWYGWAWTLRPALALLRGTRPPSKFFVIWADLA